MTVKVRKDVGIRRRVRVYGNQIMEYFIAQLVISLYPNDVRGEEECKGFGDCSSNSKGGYIGNSED